MGNKLPGAKVAGRIFSMNTAVGLAALASLWLAEGNTLVLAADVPDGTALNSSNYDTLKDEAFEGNKIANMMAQQYEMLVRNHKLTARIDNARPYEVDQRLVDLTERYAEKVRLDPETPQVLNYVAGIPFPDISLDDPQGGLKLAYNIVYSAFLGDVLDWPELPFIMVTPNGYQRTITYRFSLYQMIGRRTDGNNHTEGDGPIRSLTTLIALEPHDVRGLGTFAIRYSDGRYDDIWLYLRTVRRWRRLVGSAWFDPVLGSDFLNDETSNGFNADPAWFKSFRLLARKTILFPETETEIHYYMNETSIPARLPTTDITTPPYWNTKDTGEVWRPRDVWILEAIPPDHHPMMRRILYVDANTYMPIVYHNEGYDRAGTLWHIYTNSPRRTMTMDGYPTLDPVFARLIDIKNMSATLIVSGGGRRVNPPGVTNEDFNLTAVQELLQ